MPVSKKITAFLSGFFGSFCKPKPQEKEEFIAVELQKVRNIPCIIFAFGQFRGYVYGGPYRKKPHDIIGVKMAEEIHEKCDVSIPTVDFSVPKVHDLTQGVMIAMAHLKEHGELYVGCMGGIGRTGLFMATLARLMEMNGDLGICQDTGVPPSIMYVRDNYCGHAVETKEQMKYITKLDLDDTYRVAKAIFG